jgi:hypothetical protein
MQGRAMKIMLVICSIAMAAAFRIIYEIGTPCNAYSYASTMLQVLAILLSAIPIVMLPTRWIDTSNKLELRTAYFLAIAMPVFFIHFGGKILLSIGSLGSP